MMRRWCTISAVGFAPLSSRERVPRHIADRDTLERAAGIEADDLDQPVWPTMRWEEQKRRLAKLEKSGTFKLYRLWRTLAEEAGRTGPLAAGHSATGWPRWRATGIRIRLYWRPTWHVPSVPVILLDASLDETLAGKFLPRLEVHAIPAVRRAEIVQVVDTVCSRNRLLSYEVTAGDRAAPIVASMRSGWSRRGEAHDGGKVALVTYKPAGRG